MRLKSVELYGFKSFPDRTVIEFGNGITAVLGPNGCGKSNVVDAIKWVLGEKSAKNLRGEEMLDVIFSGCATRSPSGMAEVKLNFDNTDQLLPLPYNEVSVGRRLYRSKESEYFINNRRCLLKEIRELFLDTGVGNSAYSVIEQGRVEALLHAKPADRRAVFEEAAGIAKFKVKRKEILSRLERTEQILLRVSDRVEEKEKQIRKVATQAANARRHRRLSEERDQLRTHLYRRQYAEQSTILKELAGRRAELESSLGNEENVLASLNHDFTRISGEETELNTSREEVVTAAAATQEELSALQLEQSGARNRIDSLIADIERGNERRNELSARLDRLVALEIESRTLLSEARTLARQLEERFNSQDRDRQDLLEKATNAETEVTELRNRLLDCNRGRQQMSDEAARLEAAEQSAATRRSEIEARLAKIRAETAEVEQAVMKLDEEYRQAADAAGQAVDRLESSRSGMRQLAAEAERLQSEERATESERASKASRKATLEDLENSFAGAYEGVKNILMAARDNHPDCRGVIGMALDLMTVPQDLALAVETILGASAQDVVVESARDAQSAIEHLKRHRLGRATFLPLDRIQPRRRLTQNLNHIRGVIGEAVDLVSFNPRHRAVMEYLLAGILVVEDLGLARELSGREARGMKIVTLEGDVVNPSGAMTGGHGRQQRAGLVQRKAELDALVDDLADCERRLAEKSRLRAEVLGRIRELESQTAEFERTLAEAGRSEAGLKQNLAVRKSELERLFRDRSDAETELAGVSFGGGERLGELERLKTRLAESAGEMAVLEQNIVVKTEEQRRARSALDSLGQEYAALAGERSSAQAKVRELESRIGEMASEQHVCREELKRPGLSGSETEAEIAELRERLTALGDKEVELLRRRDEQKAVGVELLERLAECRSQIEGLRQRERDTQTQINRLREGLSQIDRQATESNVRMETIREKARQELQLEDLELPAIIPGVSAMLAEDGSLPPPTIGETEEKDEPVPEWAGLPDIELQSRIDEVCQKIRNIGSINPEAIDELAELEAGAEFLRSHKEEQEEAVADMRTAIERLNEESSTRFQETFAAVRTNFQQMFTRLFGGGKADLVLEEVTEPGADPLDAGIDISAQPPNKEPKSISLLSGGEKALCAVALLFALFRSKPSPFCILDEVDGPLDESNIDRFMQQISDFTDDTQFIIITHSQRTMSMVDRIWGVTQDVPGISTLRSLEFKTMEEMSAERPSRSSAAESTREYHEEALLA